jgi:valyl-tRNA synthetase
MSVSLPKVYSPAFEEDLYREREQSWYFNPDTTGEEYLGSQRPDQERPLFVMPLPPPNVTGILHMGHALMVAVEDTMCRFHRMKWYRTLWIPGTDHAWIATQVVVERMLMDQDKKTKYELWREHFLSRVWQRVRSSRSTIINQTKRLGASLDWSREQFTLSESLSRAVRTAFVRLYSSKRIYKAPYMVNWSPKAQTVLSDIEVDHKETEGKLYYIRYFVEGKGDSILIATTRPETIFADVALAVHPKDKRYKKWIGKNALIPLVNRPIPIIADEYVDVDFGTGALKVTPTHDENDYQIALRHWLPMDAFAFDNHCVYTQLAVEDLVGKDVYEFFPNLIQLLQEIGNMDSLEEYTHSVPYCSRTGCRVQPMLSQQWFMDVAPAADRIIREVENDGVIIHPARYGKTFIQWLEGIKPWCISRQLWWGHRIPVWIAPDGRQFAFDDSNVIAYWTWTHSLLSKIIFNCIADSRLSQKFHGEQLLEVLLAPTLPERIGRVVDGYLDIYLSSWLPDPRLAKEIAELRGILGALTPDADAEDVVKAGVKLADVLENSCNIVMRDDRYEFVFYDGDQELVWLVQEEDVLDTWFSSALWPFSIVWWPEETPDLARFYPMHVLETGYDIIFFWVIRMMIMGHELTDQMPFRHVYLHGLVKDEYGQKISKSKWNAVDPMLMVEQYGADAVRGALLQGNTPWNDAKFSEKKVEYMSRFINKLWNATRFVALRFYNDVQGWDSSESGAWGLWVAWGGGEWEVQHSMVGVSYDDVYDDILHNIDALNHYDLWMLGKVQTTVDQVTKYNGKFMLGEALQDTIHMTWHDFCDWYIELTKLEQSPYTYKVMLYSLLTALKLLHPVFPFVTDKLWQLLRVDGNLPVSARPAPNFPLDSDYKMNLLMDMISQWRTLRSQVVDKPHEKVVLYVQSNSQIHQLVRDHMSILTNIINVDSVVFVELHDEVPLDVLTTLILDIKIGIKGIKELNRKDRLAELEKMVVEEEQFLQRMRSMLTNASFTSNAPPAVIEEKKAKMQEVKQKITQMTMEISKLKMLHK